jgi:hypothetical protein
MIWFSSLPRCCAHALESISTRGLLGYKAVNLPPLQSFAAGIEKDNDAVRAGLTWWGSQRDGGRPREQAQIDEKTELWQGRLSSAS